MKKIRPGSIEIDMEAMALVVNYEYDAPITDGQEDGVRTEKKTGQKRIKVGSLLEGFSPEAAAEEIISRHKLIQQSKFSTVVSLLIQLQSMKLNNAAKLDKDDHGADRYFKEKRGKEAIKDTFALAEKAQISKIDEYIEQLYEGIEEKIKATYSILQLSRELEFLEQLISNETLLLALSRTLKDEGRKSNDLGINIVFIFYNFSIFSKFHSVLVGHQVPEMIMVLCTYEIKRHQHRLQSDAEKHQDSEKLLLIHRKQEKLLCACFHVLLNLAEDTAVEEKLRNRIVSPLLSMLERRSVELLIVTVTFLKKLSIFAENMADMKAGSIVEKLCRFTPCSNEILTSLSLRLLLNLSFDSSLRQRMVDAALLPKLLDMLKRGLFRDLVVRVLYQLSIDGKNRAAFVASDTTRLLMGLVMEGGGDAAHKAAVGLLINVARDASAAQAILDGDECTALMRRLMRTHDPLLMKIVRNLSAHDVPARRKLLPFVPEMLRVLVTMGTADMLVEVLGTLANLPVDHSFLKHLVQYNLVDVLSKFLTGASSADDQVVVQVVAFIASFAGDSACAAAVAKSSIPTLLSQLLPDKQEDDALVLAITAALCQMLTQPDTRTLLLAHTQVPLYLVDLSDDADADVRAMADAALDLVTDADESWGKQIRQRKFRMHNAQWLDAVSHDQQDEVAQGAPWMADRLGPSSNAGGVSDTFDQSMYLPVDKAYTVDMDHDDYLT